MTAFSSNDVSFVIFGHQTWDLEGGGGQLDPPQHILVFKYPSRDRVKLENFKLQEKSKFLNVVLIQGNPEKIRLYARKLTEHDNQKVQLYIIFKR